MAKKRQSKEYMMNSKDAVLDTGPNNSKEKQEEALQEIIKKDSKPQLEWVDLCTEAASIVPTSNGEEYNGAIITSTGGEVNPKEIQDWMNAPMGEPKESIDIAELLYEEVVKFKKTNGRLPLNLSELKEVVDNAVKRF